MCEVGDVRAMGGILGWIKRRRERLSPWRTRLLAADPAGREHDRARSPHSAIVG